MAIDPANQFPGQINPSSPAYPYGSAKDVTIPLDGTGTPFTAALINDTFGFQQALLQEANIFPTGAPDQVGASQYLDALDAIIAAAILVAKQNLNPVGTIYTSKDPTDPNTIFGFGVWAQIAVGKVLVGLDVSDPDFNTPGQTGGSKAHVLSNAEIPPHNHQWYDTVGGGAQSIDTAANPGGRSFNSAGNSQNLRDDSAPDEINLDQYTNGNTAIAGAAAAHNNVQPYEVVYYWERTA
jgi:hypothetical protein